MLTKFIIAGVLLVVLGVAAYNFPGLYAETCPEGLTLKDHRCFGRNGEETHPLLVGPVWSKFSK
jgi:hypothetical protein